jgi:hypothetical protein
MRTPITFGDALPLAPFPFFRTTSNKLMDSWNLNPWVR